MTKIAIISQAEQGVLIDISGCSSVTEAKQYLTSTLQVSSQFWEGLVVDLNLGPLVLTPAEVNEIQEIVFEVGVQPRQIFSLSPITRASLIHCRLPVGGLSQLEGYVPMKAIDILDGKPDLAVAHTAAPQVCEPEFDFNFAPSGLESGAEGTPRTNSYQSATNSGCSIDCSTEAEAPSVSLSRCMVLPERGSDTTAPGEPIVINSIMLPELLVAGNGSLEMPDTVPTSTQTPVRQGRLYMPNHHLIPGQADEKITKPEPRPFRQSARTARQAPPKQAAVLMMKQTLRSGQRVCHKGHLVIIGDVNPGAELVADGDITVWGALRGMAHAGASGDTKAEIRALKFGSTQLRIAQAIARSPDRSKVGGSAPSVPETARVVDGKIRLSGSDPE